MNFERYAPDANLFLHDIARELGDEQNIDHAFRVMRSVFHTVREVLSPEESLHLISQLPLIIKGVYVDGWHVHSNIKIRSMNEFLVRLRLNDERSAIRDFGDDETAKARVKSVFNVLKKHVSAGEIQHMIDQFPTDLISLWSTEEKDVINKEQYE